MLRRITNGKIVQPSTGLATKIEDLVPARMVDGAINGSNINGKPQHEGCMGLE